MLALYLIAAHLVGDVVLQTRWQAEGKFDRVGYRFRHVLAYTAPFVPIASVYAEFGRAVTFLCLLFVLHFLTDSRRFRSTPGEVVAWYVQAWPLYLPDDDPPKLPPNPWPPMGILIDQALHVCQLALLGGLLLS